MTSSNVPPKFYQVCRLCLSVVSDTSDLIKLSVFGSNKCHQQQRQQFRSQQPEEIIVPVAPSTISSIKLANSVIVKSKSTKNAKKSNRKNSADDVDDSEKVTATNEEAANDQDDGDDDDELMNKVHNNNNIDLDQEHFSEADKNINYYGASAAGSTHFKTDGVAAGDDESHLDILERIYTFLSISVSPLVYPYLHSTYLSKYLYTHLFL